MCEGSSDNISFYGLGLLRREWIKRSSQRLERSIDFLGAEGVKITSLGQRQHCSSTLDLYKKRTKSGKGRKMELERGTKRKALSGSRIPSSGRSTEQGDFLQENQNQVVCRGCCGWQLPVGTPALCLQESSGKGHGRVGSGPMTLAAKDFSG